MRTKPIIKIFVVGAMLVSGAGYGGEKASAEKSRVNENHSAKNEAANLANLKGPYLGQQPPGLTPKVFAPGIISTPHWEYGMVVAPGLKEIYYIRENPDNLEQELMMYQQKGDTWHLKKLGERRGTPTFSQDGQTMHLGRGFRSRTEEGWSDIFRTGPDFEPFLIMRLTSSTKGTYVFDEVGPDNGSSILRYSKLVDGKRQAPQPLDKTINTGKYNAHPFIAPDESYIIWDGQRGSKVRNADLFISFKQNDGSWGKAIKMGPEINTKASEFAALVSPDGKYLFFNRNMGPDNTDTFWVDAKVIDELRAKSQLAMRKRNLK